MVTHTHPSIHQVKCTYICTAMQKLYNEGFYAGTYAHIHNIIQYIQCTHNTHIYTYKVHTYVLNTYNTCGHIQK